MDFFFYLLSNKRCCMTLCCDLLFIPGPVYTPHKTSPLPQLGLWTFAFSPRFSFPLRPRSFFHTRQRFPISNPYQIHIWTIYGSRTTPDASIGLVPYQTHIKSIYGPYMGHPRSPNWTLDFEPAFSPRFCFLLSPRSLFPTAQRFPIPKHVTSGLGVTSGDVTSGSGHVISGSGYDVILTSKRGSSCLVIGHYYCLLQRYAWLRTE